MDSLKITSSAFEQNEEIPAKYTCDGENINPPLEISGFPDATKSLAIIVDDPDAPMGTWVHWIIWNIEPTSMIAENSAPGVQGMTDFRETNYGGPCPPSGTHRYFFKVYALDEKLELEPGSTKDALENSIRGHILAKGELIGLYSKK